MKATEQNPTARKFETFLMPLSSLPSYPDHIALVEEYRKYVLELMCSGDDMPPVGSYAYRMQQNMLLLGAYLEELGNTVILKDAQKVRSSFLAITGEKYD